MIDRIMMWYFLLNKRLFKKMSFLLILCLVPIMVGGMRLVAQEESGIVRIALCMENPEDELSVSIVDELMNEGNDVIRYVLCEKEDEARKLVTEYEADAAWIFPEDLQKSLQETTHEKEIKPVVTVVQREDNVLMIFTREILCSALYPSFSYKVYENFVRKDMELETVSDEELQEAYDRMLVEGSLFQMVYLDGQQEVNDYNYLQAPLRGMLAVWLVLCGFAASMYFIQDERKGFFSRVPVRYRLWAAFGAYAVLLSDAGIVLLVSCKLAGVFTLWYREVLSAVLFVCCTLVFCNLIRLICRSPEKIGSCTAILLIGMLVLCPIFINIKKFNAVQYLLPPFYYLRSIHSMYYLYGMAIYTVVLFVLCVLIFRWQNRDYN